MTIQRPVTAHSPIPGDDRTLSIEATHELVVCVTCRPRGSEERPGKALLADLAERMSGDAAWRVGGIECMAACGRPCAIALQSPDKTTWLFGDMDLTDAEDIARFARQYEDLPDGWCKASERPGKLARTALARIPASGRVLPPDADACT